ncbi:MAG: type 4a pilus biogenesis protein PilO [Myxococcota bacterium]
MELSPELQSRLEQVAKLPKGARIGILFGIVAAICAGYYFSIYEAENERLKTLQAKEMELQRKLSEVRSIAANISAFEAEITELEVQLAAALRQLPNQKQLEVLLADISNLGKTAGIEIKSFKRKNEVVHDFYAEVPIAIKLEGNYHEVARFFDLIAKLPRIVNMGAIKMKVANESEVETRLTVNGTATTFRFVGQG